MNPYDRNNPPNISSVQFNTLDLDAGYVNKPFTISTDPNYTNSFTKAAQASNQKNHNVSPEDKERICQILNQAFNKDS